MASRLMDRWHTLLARLGSHCETAAWRQSQTRLVYSSAGGVEGTGYALLWW